MSAPTLPSLADLLTMSGYGKPAGASGHPQPQALPSPMPVGQGAPQAPPDYGYSDSRLYSPQHYDPSTGGAAWPYPHVAAPPLGAGDYLALGLQGLPETPPRLSGSSHPGPGGLEQFLSGLAHGYSAARLAGLGQKQSERDKLNQALAEKAKNDNAQALEATKQLTASKLALGNEEALVDYRNKNNPKEELLTADQAAALGPWAKPGIGKLTQAATIQALKPSAQEFMMGSMDPKAIADAVQSGLFPPDMVTLGSRPGSPGSQVATVLAKRGYDLSKARLEMQAMRAITQSANSGQIANLMRASNTVEQAMGNLDALSTQLSKSIPRTALPIANKFSLAAAVNGLYGSEAQQVARTFQGQVEILRSEFPNVLNGGYAPTKEAQDQANKVLSPFDGEGTLAAMLKTLHQNIDYKTNSVRSLGAMVPGQGAPQMFPSMGGAGGAGTAPAPAPTAPGVPAPTKPTAPKMTGIKVLMKDPGGNPYMVDQAEVDDSIAHGWSLASPVSAHARARK